MLSLSDRSNETLLIDIKELRRKECQYIADVVLYLAEIESRGIYRDAGYSSLFTYCHEALGYSEGSSHRRVKAAAALLKAPELYERLKSGTITLCALSEVSPVLTLENKDAVIASTEGISRRQAERVAAEFGAPRKAAREVVKIRKVSVPARPVDSLPLAATCSGEKPTDAVPRTEERVSVRFELSKNVWKLVEEAQEILGSVPVSKVFETTLRTFISKHRPKDVRRKRKTSPVERQPGLASTGHKRTSGGTSPAEEKTTLSTSERKRSTEFTSPVEEKSVRPSTGEKILAGLTSPAKRCSTVNTSVNPMKSTSPAEVQKRSRVISRPIKRTVYARDGGRCTFVAPDGTRCSERRALQIDHIHPFSLGGSNDESNLRLLCPSHNRLYAERVFGVMACRGKRSSVGRR